MALIRAFNNVKIGLKLPLISTLIVVASITAMGWNAYQRSNESLLERAHLGLQSVAEYQASMLTTLLLAVDRNLRIEAASPFTVDSLKKFAIAYDRFEDPTAELQRIYIDENPNPAGSRDELVIAPENSPFALMHSRFHPSFRATLKEFGYYDIFLFDTAGNLVYSVFKGADFATNFLDGQWRDTNLAQAYASAMEAGPNDRAIFADFARYGPSADAPAAFLARPVFDESGTRIGVMAFQLPSSLLNSTLANPIGLGETGDAYVFGNDGFYRSDTLQTEEDDTLVAQVDIGDMFNGLQDQEGIVEFLDASGQPVLAYVQPVNGLGQTWFLIAQQKLHEVLAPSAALKSSFLLLGSLTVAVGAAFSLLLSRSISAPLDRLGAAMADVAARNFETDVRDSTRGDEIGEMGRKLEAFRDELSNAEREGRLVAFQSTAFQGSSSPMMTVDAEYKINFLNAAMEELLESMKTDLEAAGGGAQSEELVGQSFEVFACIAPEKIKGLMSEASLPRSIIYRIGDRTIEITGANVEDGAGTRIGAVYEWKDRSADIRNSSIIDAVDKTQSLVEFAPDGQILSANSTFCALIGLPPQELVGGNAKRLITFDQKNQPDQCDAWDSAARGDTVFGRFSLETEQAQVLEGSLNPILDETAETDRLVLIANDITEAQREKKRAEATQAAMQASQQKVVDALRQGLKDLSNGVLTTAITTEFEPEYEGLRSDYNATLKQLSSAISAIIETTEKIHGEITEINSAASDLSGRTENQAATLEETAAAVDELSASVSSAADGASKAAEIVNEAKSNAEESGKVVQEAVAAMSEIQASSTEISKIIKVIDDIAFQTNLLALNAGVEAARAGDAGRGFAVVASEVRALAQRSSDAAREINGLISESGAQVKRGVDIVGATGTALAQIVASVTDIASHVNSIAASATEQAGGLKEINTAMNQLDQVTQQNTAMFEETSAASQALMREAQGLTKTVSQFDIGRPIAQGDQPASAPQERVMDIRGANQNAGSKPTFQPQAHGSVHASPKTPAGNTAIAVDPDEEWEDF